MSIAIKDRIKIDPNSPEAQRILQGFETLKAKELAMYHYKKWANLREETAREKALFEFSRDQLFELEDLFGIDVSDLPIQCRA